MSTSSSLTAPLRVSFDYTRSVGPVLGVFFAGLREGRLIGAHTSRGVVVPPPEYDGAQPPSEFVEVADQGVVTSWVWVCEPVAGQPLDRPFAFALITLDGADAAMLHAVDVAGSEQIHSGMRVKARWRPARIGAITDIECFEPVEVSESVKHGSRPLPSTLTEPLLTPVQVDYTYAASVEESRFFRGLAQGRILGQRCPACTKVYVPPRGACPVDGVPTTEEVHLPDTGTVTTFCIVNVPFPGQRIAPPYVSAYVLLDGADIAFLHLVLGIPADEVRMGMRVQAVWRPRQEWTTSMENISHFEPSGEPDADYESYSRHL